MRKRARLIAVLPIVVIVEVLILATSPIAVAISAVVSLGARSSRPTRATVLVIAYSWIELSTLVRIQAGVEDWDALLRDVLGTAYRTMRRVLAVTIRLEAESATSAQVQKSKGLIVLSRHCGPGDTLFVAWLLAEHYRLRLRIVLKDALLWEPTINAVSNHLRLFFVRRGSSRSRDGIRDLASDIGVGDCLLLFPEGANFTWARWQNAVQRLTAAGDYARARLARSQTHTLPPRPGGAIAALEAAPNADVMLLAHSGLSDDGRDRPWWRVPIRQELTVRTILLPAASVPRDPDAARGFLDNAWSQVDVWVEGHADLIEFGASPAA